MNVVDSAISSIRQKAGNLFGDIYKSSNNIVNNVSNSISSVPYAISNMSINNQKKSKIGVTNEQYGQELDKVYAPYTDPQLEAMPEKQFKKLISPVEKKYYQLPPKSDPALDQYKKELLSSQNLRPSAVNYLKDIPLTVNKLYGDTQGISMGQGTPTRQIQLSSDLINRPGNTYPSQMLRVGGNQSINPMVLKKEDIKGVLRHEYLHQVPQGIPIFLAGTPDKQTENYYVDRWGKDYMGDKKTLMKEMFAEQDLPPQYYWHIFKKVSPNATPAQFTSIFQDTLNKALQFAGINK